MYSVSRKVRRRKAPADSCAPQVLRCRSSVARLLHLDPADPMAWPPERKPPESQRILPKQPARPRHPAVDPAIWSPPSVLARTSPGRGSREALTSRIVVNTVATCIRCGRRPQWLTTACAATEPAHRAGTAKRVPALPRRRPATSGLKAERCHAPSRCYRLRDVDRLTARTTVGRTT